MSLESVHPYTFSIIPLGALISGIIFVFVKAPVLPVIHRRASVIKFHLCLMIDFARFIVMSSISNQLLYFVALARKAGEIQDMRNWCWYDPSEFFAGIWRMPIVWGIYSVFLARIWWPWHFGILTLWYPWFIEIQRIILAHWFPQLPKDCRCFRQQTSSVRVFCPAVLQFPLLYWTSVKSVILWQCPAGCVKTRSLHSNSCL